MQKKPPTGGGSYGNEADVYLLLGLGCLLIDFAGNGFFRLRQESDAYLTT